MFLVRIRNSHNIPEDIGLGTLFGSFGRFDRRRIKVERAGADNPTMEPERGVPHWRNVGQSHPSQAPPCLAG